MYLVKAKLITWLLIFFCPIFVWANVEKDGRVNVMTKYRLLSVGHRVDSLAFTIDLEDEDGVYISPQMVSFTIQTNMPVDKLDSRLVCIITTDMYLPVDSLSFAVKRELSGSVCQKISFLPPVAGFYRISVYVENEATRSQVHKFNIGYNPEQIVSPPDAKADFAEFWEKTRAELDHVKPHYKVTLLKEKCSAIKNMYHVEMYSLGNVKIEGYYTVPKKPGKHPAIIQFMGYAAKPRFLNPDAMPDFCEFMLSVRGQGIQKAINPYGEWIVNGVSNKDTYYYRGAYMDLVRGVDFLTSRPEVDAERILAEGGSQGGAFTLVVCALDKRIIAAAPRIPFLSDFRDYFRICPWPRSVFTKYLKEHPDENWEGIYDVLSYFDVKNFVGRIHCPLIMGIGLQDETCPPHTNFATYNLINSRKKYYVYPEQKHNVGLDWWSIREAFFKEKVKK